MITPFGGGKELESLWAPAEQLGEFLRDAGFLGIFDLDGGLVNDVLFVTEANVRRTGGTYLHELATSLFGTDNPVQWCADASPGRLDIGFGDAVALIDEANLSPDLASPGESGVVLTADTLSADGKWRYLAYGKTAEIAAEAERATRAILGILD